MNSTLMRWLLLQPRQQLEDLALDRHVERGRRLVGDQQLGLAGQRHRDHHALLLAARHLVRIAASRRFGSGMPTSTSSASARVAAPGAAAGPGASSAARRAAWPTVNTGFSELIGSWNTQAISLPRSACSSGSAGLQQVRPCHRMRPSRIGVVGQQVQHRHRGDALARARFADQRDGGVLGDVEADALDGLGDCTRARPCGSATFRSCMRQQHASFQHRAAWDRARRAARRPSARTR